jgi:hypothetical protein
VPFPNLTLLAGRTNLSEATGAPDNGNNTFLHGWNLDPSQIDEELIELEYVLIDPSVTAVSFVSLSPDKLSLTLNFTQSGAGQVQVVAKHQHSAGA